MHSNSLESLTDIEEGEKELPAVAHVVMMNNKSNNNADYTGQPKITSIVNPHKEMTKQITKDSI